MPDFSKNNIRQVPQPSSIREALAGLRQALSHEAAFRQDFLLGIISVPISFVLNISAPNRLILTLLWLAILAAELLNTAIEAVVDHATKEWHPLAKQAKDMGSAAVFCTLSAFFVSWAVTIVRMFF